MKKKITFPAFVLVSLLATTPSVFAADPQAGPPVDPALAANLRSHDVNVPLDSLKQNVSGIEFSVSLKRHQDEKVGYIRSNPYAHSRQMFWESNWKEHCKDFEKTHPGNCYFDFIAVQTHIRSYDQANGAELACALRQTKALTEVLKNPENRELFSAMKIQTIQLNLTNTEAATYAFKSMIDNPTAEFSGDRLNLNATVYSYENSDGCKVVDQASLSEKFKSWSVTFQKSNPAVATAKSLQDTIKEMATFLAPPSREIASSPAVNGTAGCKPVSAPAATEPAASDLGSKAVRAFGE